MFYSSMTYTIEKSPTNGFFIKLDGEIVGWTATPWGARMFIDKHDRNNPLP
jgi:hypothetical protein